MKLTHEELQDLLFFAREGIRQCTYPAGQERTAALLQRLETQSPHGLDGPTLAALERELERAVAALLPAWEGWEASRAEAERTFERAMNALESPEQQHLTLEQASGWRRTSRTTRDNLLRAAEAAWTEAQTAVRVEVDRALRGRRNLEETLTRLHALNRLLRGRPLCHWASYARSLTERS